MQACRVATRGVMVMLAWVARRGAAIFLHVSSARAFRALKACAARRAEDRELTRRALLKTTPLGAAFAAWTRHLAARRQHVRIEEPLLIQLLESWIALLEPRQRLWAGSASHYRSRPVLGVAAGK